jgi:hypothetical protein
VSDEDWKVKVSGADTTPNFLSPKLAAGPGISLAVLNPGANEQVEITATAVSEDHKVSVTAADTTPSFLSPKLAAGTAVTLTVLNPAANEQLRIDVSGTTPPPSTGYKIPLEDFLTANGTSIGNNLWVGATAGAGSTSNVGSTFADGSHQGILQLRSGSTATGRASARQGGLAYSNVAAAGGSSSVEFLATRGDALSVVGDAYNMLLGWSDSTGGLGFGANAALFTHDPALSLTNWVAKTIVGGVPTNTVTAAPIAGIGVWGKLRIDIDLANGARFYVNNVLVATHLIGTMPGATSGFWAPIIAIERLTSLGPPVTRTLYVDYCDLSFVLSGPR